MSEEGKSDWMLVAKVGYATLALLATGICAWFAVVTAEEHHAGAAMITLHHCCSRSPNISEWVSGLSEHCR